VAKKPKVRPPHRVVPAIFDLSQLNRYASNGWVFPGKRI
jgi:hypothetical protein